MAEGEVKVDVQDASTDEVDFSKIPINEALQILQATPHGLSSAEHAKRLEEYGPNKLPESYRNPILVFLGYMWNPLAWAMEVAAIISICLLDYADFALIVALLIANSVISYHEEANADAAIKALTAALAPKARVFRDGVMKQVEASELVPGDVILICIGNVVPADIKILAEEDDDGSEEVPMQVDQAALTGESLPSKKFTGDVCYSGSSIKQGERHCVVYATGINTFFGRAAALIGQTNNVANLVVVMNRIGGTCLATIGIWIIIELAVQFGHYNHSCGAGEEACPTLTNMLVIIVGGIPIAMPTVLSVTLALGAANLAKEGAIVARMSAVEELAGLDILCSDKTGTLTLNKLSVDVSSVMCVSGRSLDFVVKHSALSANTITEEPIDVVLHNSYADKADLANYQLTKFVPFNPTDKITIASLTDSRTGQKFRVLKGSPQVVLGKAFNKADIADVVNNKMIEFANRGFRSLGVAYADGDGVGVETSWEMIGLIPMFDPPRHDTQATIENCQKQGIEVKMITGDHLLIGKETCKMLGMGTQMFTSEVLIKARHGDTEALHGFANVTEMCEKCNGFAEVFPEHKFEIVEILQNADHVCGMTGDGVNDAPALKKADVGIAVDGATDAARGAADIVLTQPGLSTIVTAVIGARKIFQRMTTYAKYTVSMTFRICFTFGLLTVIYDWYFPTILIVILAVFNDGAMIALAKDRVIASTVPNSWNLKNIFLMGIVYGLYLTLSSWALYQTAVKTDFFASKCGLFSLEDRHDVLMSWCKSRLQGPDFSAVRASIYSSFPSMPQDLATLGNVSACALGGGERGYFDVLASEGQCQYFGTDNPQGWLPQPGTPNILQQCLSEQKYVRGAMMRSLLYNQVSISGQALVFVVRTQEWSITNRAGAATYIAFISAQIGSTLIAAFGFNGYTHPRFAIEGGIFSTLSTGNPTPFFNNEVPIALTESSYTASVIGCTSYVIVAWIWSAIWHIPLDIVKWILCYILNDDGFRDKVAYAEDHQHRANIQPKENELSGMVAPSTGNPLGRVSLKQPVSQVLDRKSASVVPVSRNSAGGIAKVSADPSKALNIARKSQIKQHES